MDRQNKGQVVGYARVSAADQNLARQLKSLEGCDRVFADKLSGKNTDREQLQEMLRANPKNPGTSGPNKGVVTGELTRTGVNGMLLTGGIALLLAAAGTAVAVLRRRGLEVSEEV